MWHKIIKLYGHKQLLIY